MLIKALTQGYHFVSFEESKALKSMKYVILRHDVDISLERAVRVAEIERNLAVSSTFFLMLHSPFYNLMDEESSRYVKQLHALGHWIGYHYDLGMLGSKPKLVLEAEVELVSRFFQTPITMIALHNPTSYSKKSFEVPENDVYSCQFFSEIKYVSDSLQRWREGCFCEHLGHFPQIQLLIHPFWWSSSGESWERLLRRYRATRERELDSRFARYKAFVRHLRYTQFPTRYESRAHSYCSY